MIPLLLAFRGLVRALAAVWRDPETKALPVVAGALVLTGSLFYWRFEDWTFIEALYFSIVTLTTVGYGDFSPTTAGTQIFTIFYILTGFGVLVALLTSVAQQYLRQKAEAGPARARLKARRQRDPSPERGRIVTAPAESATEDVSIALFRLANRLLPLMYDRGRRRPLGRLRQRGVRAGLERLAPAREDGVHAGGADDRFGRCLEVRGWRMNARVWNPPMPPWKQISSSNAQPSSSSGS